jgi:hypothetical protein
MQHEYLAYAILNNTKIALCRHTSLANFRLVVSRAEMRHTAVAPKGGVPKLFENLLMRITFAHRVAALRQSRRSESEVLINGDVSGVG